MLPSHVHARIDKFHEAGAVTSEPHSGVPKKRTSASFHTGNSTKIRQLT